MIRPYFSQPDPCPFVNEGDSRCSSRFTLGHLSEAFEMCMGGGYPGCATYYRILQNRRNSLVSLTCHGRTLQSTGS